MALAQPCDLHSPYLADPVWPKVGFWSLKFHDTTGTSSNRLDKLMPYFPPQLSDMLASFPSSLILLSSFVEKVRRIAPSLSNRLIFSLHISRSGFLSFISDWLVDRQCNFRFRISAWIDVNNVTLTKCVTHLLVNTAYSIYLYSVLFAVVYNKFASHIGNSYFPAIVLFTTSEKFRKFANYLNHTPATLINS